MDGSTCSRRTSRHTPPTTFASHLEGVWRSSTSPRPSLPFSPAPHVYSSPEAVTAAVYANPHATWRMMHGRTKSPWIADDGSRMMDRGVVERHASGNARNDRVEENRGPPQHARQAGRQAGMERHRQKVGAVFQQASAASTLLGYMPVFGLSTQVARFSRCLPPLAANR